MLLLSTTEHSPSQACHYAASQARSADYLYLNIVQSKDTVAAFTRIAVSLTVQSYLAARASRVSFVFAGHLNGRAADHTPPDSCSAANQKEW